MDITNKYNIKYRIKTNYTYYNFSYLLVFPHSIDDDDYIITATNSDSQIIDESATKIYSLNNGHFIKYFKYLINESQINYLLSWYNETNQQYFII